MKDPDRSVAQIEPTEMIETSESGLGGRKPRVYGNRAPIEAVTVFSEAGLAEPPCDHLDYTESIIPL